MAEQPTAIVESVEEPSEPLKYKTWVLKVSVHCEGCKRKVKKILHGIEGVYTVDVDSKLHKATVTGNVEPEILIRKLEKSGKHAELWTEKNEQKESKRSKKKKGKQNDQDDPESNNNNESAHAEPEKPEPIRVEVTGPPSKVVEVVSSAKPGGSVQFKEVKPEYSPAAENSHGPPEGDGAADKGGSNANSGGVNGGGGKRKKKKKGNNGNQGEPSGDNNSNGNAQHPPPHGQGAVPLEAAPLYRCPPCSYPVYHHPPSYYAPPPAAAPVYAVSYNTAYPSSSYTASYYASPPLYSYAYVHQGSDSGDGGPSPLDWNNGGASQPSDTFEIFSDENPNACYVM